jgi:hypothetical protein
VWPAWRGDATWANRTVATLLTGRYPRGHSRHFVTVIMRKLHCGHPCSVALCLVTRRSVHTRHSLQTRSSAGLPDRRLPPRLSWILPSSGLIRGVRWFITDVSGLPTGTKLSCLEQLDILMTAYMQAKTCSQILLQSELLDWFTLISPLIVHTKTCIFNLYKILHLGGGGRAGSLSHV